MKQEDNNFITLNNGVQIPKIGFGVFRITNEKECENSVIQALQAGYRLIDTAAAYENEIAVGNAIKKSGIPRKDIFVTTKLWITDTSYEKAKSGLEHSLARLGLDYIDLYLIHQPYNDYYGAWKALEELYRGGKIKAIGVDNFTQDKLADFIFFNNIKPAVNMIECNPFFQRENERKYMEEQEIQMQAWSPLSAGQGNLFNNHLLCQIAQNHNKSVAQIVLRWLVQRNIIPIVKSTNPSRIKENFNIFDFQLTQYEMEQISTLDTGHSCFGSRKTAKEVTEFLQKALLYNV